jgi:tetratricopeptide (TPR) repeat protein
MPNQRLEALQRFVEASPEDCFARYGLAQEHAKLGEHEKAIEQFRKILEINAGYQAAYYHAGKTYEKMGRVDEARAIHQRGVAVASQSGDLHAQSELQAALEAISS